MAVTSGDLGSSLSILFSDHAKSAFRFDLLAQLFVLCSQRRFLRGQFIDFPLHFLFTDICHTAPQSYGFVINPLYHKTAEPPSVYAGFRLFYKTVFGVIFCTARDCSTDSPSMSQRYCCGVSSRTSSGVLGPLQPSFFNAFVEEQETVTLPEQDLEPIPATAEKQEKRRLERIHLELLDDAGTEPINGPAHVRIATGDEDMFC